MRALEDAGFAVEPAALGVAYFETRGVERLYGGLEPALRRALARGRLRVGRRGSARRSAASPRSRPPPSLGRGRSLVVARRGAAAVPRAAAADAAAARAAALRGAGSARSPEAGTACRAPGWRRRRTIGAGRPARLGPGERRGGRAGARPPPARRGGGVARVPGGGRQRADAAARARCARRDRARAAGAARPLRPQGRARRPARRRRLLAAHAHAARADRRPRPDPGRARAAARRPARAGARAARRARRADRAVRAAARAARRRRRGPRAACGRGCARCAPAPAPAPSAPSWRSHRGRASPSRARCSCRGTTERPAARRASRRTSTGRRGRSTTQPVALVREEWRVVDRWWTEEPVVRRYFEVVLETGENTVVFHDEAGGGWFTQRGS